MKETSIFYIKNILIKIVVENNKLTFLDILPDKSNNLIEPKSDLSKKIKEELSLYFSKNLKEFSIPLQIKGTDFEKKVYKALLSIKYGDTMTYKELANKIGHPKAYRAVGTAAGKNKIPIIIPCHRLIGQNHNLSGYRYGIDMKKELLKLENSI